MSVGQESELSDEGLSVGTESKDKATINLLPNEMDTGEETSVQSSPKLADSDQTKTVKSNICTFHKNTSIPTNLELKGKVEANNVYTKVCEVTTKATKISTNDLLEIKVQRQSILPESYPSDNPNDNVFSENKTQIGTHTKESHFELDILAFHANEQSLGANYSRDCITEHKNHLCSQGSNERLNNGLTMTVECAKVIPSPTEEVEALDLSLPKNPVRNSEQNQWVADTEHEGSLYMEVDEIKDDQQLVEVEQEDDSDNSWFSSLGEVHPYLPQHWERYLTSPSLCQAMPTTPDTKTVSPAQTDALLIDEQGVPYTLTLDGEKVLQTDDMLPEQQEALCLKQDEGHLLCSSADSKSQPQHNSPSPNASPCPVSLETSLKAESKVSPIAESKMSPNSVVLAKQSTLPAVPDMATVPIQIMASPTGSTTPILLLPQSQLQTLSPQASKANPGLLTLSLPIPLCQNSQSPSVLFVLSSPQVSSTPSLPLTGQVSQISSTSTVALPLASCSVEMGSTPSGSPIVSLGKVSSVNSTYISGLTNPSNVPACPTSSTASSSTSTMTSASPSKQSSTDAYSNTLVPTSFREALLRLAVSVEKKNESKLETIALSVPSTEPDSSTTELEKKEPETNCDQSLENSTTSINADQTDEVDAVNNQPSSTSRPQSPDQESQFLCPRRILYCQYCPRVFYYLSDLERHSITHSQSKPHVCHSCGKAFKRSSHLERHKHIHTGQRNFVCQLCPRRFRESGELMRHQRVHTGEKPFQCSICHMRFAERNTLRRHTKRKHQGQPLDTTDVKVKSESSGRSFDGIQGEQEENAEWYCSTVPEMEFGSDSEDEEQLQENNGCK